MSAERFEHLWATRRTAPDAVWVPEMHALRAEHAEMAALLAEGAAPRGYFQVDGGPSILVQHALDRHDYQKRVMALLARIRGEAE